MCKKILLLTDFSKSSWDAMRYILELYKGEKCDYYILNTYPKEAFGLRNIAVLDPEDTFNLMSKKASEEGLGDILAQLIKIDDNPKNNYYALSKPFDILDAVDEVLKETEIDLIVMGAKGFSGNKERSYGPTTMKIIREISNCPVMVVPRNTKFRKPKEIVLATDFRSHPAQQQMNTLLNIAKETAAEVCVLSLTDSNSMSPRQRENRILLRNRLADVPHSFHILHHVDMSTAISCFVESRDSQMVGLVRARPTFWQRMGIGKSLIDKLRYRGAVPLMALHYSK